MRRAESSRDPAERSESLGESLRLFTRAAGSLPISRLQDVSKRYRVQQYIPGTPCLHLPLVSTSKHLFEVCTSPDAQAQSNCPFVAQRTLTRTRRLTITSETAVIPLTHAKRSTKRGLNAMAV